MKTIIFLFTAIFVTASAFAEPVLFSNLYVDVFGGLNFVNSYRKDEVRVDLDTGYVVGGALGYQFRKFLRIEAEGAYRENEYAQLVVEGVPLSMSGYLKKITAMGNLYLNLPLKREALIYLGVGAGARWDKEKIVLDPIVTPEGTILFTPATISSNGFAYQGIIGLIFYSGPKLRASVEYRYLNGPDIWGNNSLCLNLRRHF